MKRSILVASLAVGLTLNVLSRAGAEDLTDRLQIGGNATAAWPLGDKSFSNQTKNVGPDFGALVAYGVNKSLSLGLSYDNIDMGKGTRLEPFLFNGIYRLFSDRSWTPNFQLGAGLIKGISDSSYYHLSAKAAVGLEYFVCPHFSIGPQVGYLYANDQTANKRNAHLVTAGLLANMFFGGETPAAPVVEKQAAAPPPPPPAAVIAIALAPAESNLGPGQTVQLNPTVTGTNNTAVTWSIAPALGTVSSTGLFTAPGTIALPETVVVTATSVADGTKSGTSQVKLTPPAEAPKEVDIRMDIFFDTNKTDVKPQYDGEIAKVATFMKTYPHSHAEIDGHTDNVGNAAYNLSLSQRRADSVRLYMIAKFDIDGNRLTAKGYGLTQPIASNDTKDGRAQNRRVVAALTAQSQ